MGKKFDSLRNIESLILVVAGLIHVIFLLFVVDLASLQVGYRVLAFLFLAIISLAASVYYTKRLRKKSES